MANTQEEPVSLPTTAVSAEDIAASPAWLPVDAAGAGAMRLVRLDEAGYRAASFLDQRLLTANPPTAVVASATVAAAAARLAPRAHYIFHIGHVGSTLVSRLVGEVAGLFSVREPAVLRDTASRATRAEAHRASAHRASIHLAEDLRGTLGLLARTWTPGQRSVVKPSSFVSEIAESILESDAGASAVLMFTPATAYLRCILGGPNSRTESRVLAPARLARLRRRLGEAAFSAAPQSEGQWIAMSWLCEMACLQDAARRFASRVLWVDFDEFLAAPRAGLEAILAALGATAKQDDIDSILAGPLMRQYSKAPEYAYDAALRREVLASAERENAAEISSGMAWLEALGTQHRAAAEALSR
ncbi:MAG: hypothetical protein ACYDAE_04320 [Steroidobacteraceae bacterium]